MKADRRTLLAGAGAAVGIGAFAYVVGGRVVELTPGEARQAGADLRSLTASEARTLEALGDTLLPGAAAAGIAHFVDHHVSVPPAESLLILRNLDIPAPFVDFYRAGLLALDGHARAVHGGVFAELDAGQMRDLVGSIARQPPEGWRGPPSPLFYFITRSDAVDVVYGTLEAVEALGIPYMAHIVPEKPW